MLVVDDHDLVRDVVGAALRASGKVEVVGSCGDGRQAIRLFDELQPDVVLMDLSMPVLGGVDTTRELRRLDPGARVVILTSARVSRELDDAYAAGALDCVYKDDDPTALIAAIVSAGAVDPVAAPSRGPLSATSVVQARRLPRPA